MVIRGIIKMESLEHALSNSFSEKYIKKPLKDAAYYSLTGLNNTGMIMGCIGGAGLSALAVYGLPLLALEGIDSQIQDEALSGLVYLGAGIPLLLAGHVLGAAGILASFKGIPNLAENVQLKIDKVFDK
jgi:hypothetical protein